MVLYGVRTVADILLREELDAWQAQHAELIRVIYCVGSRFDNVHWGVKTKDHHTAPSLPKDFNTLQHAVLVSIPLL